MKVIAQSTATTKLPYFHLAYLAANNFKGLTRTLPMFTGGLILLFAIIISVKSIKSSLNLWLRLAIVLSIVAILLIILLNSVDMSIGYYPSHSISRMSDAFQRYADKNDGVLPDAKNWCDNLIIGGCLGPRDFEFDGGDVLYGESAFAFNSNLAGGKTSDIPPDTILLFETDLGHDVNSREATVSSRSFFDDAFKKSNSVSYCINVNISEKRWNQSGGLEILSNRYNDEKGCDILFVDGHTEFVPAKKIKNLIW